ncbi:hypothetical protein ASD68_04445 [Rhodanobacter sp. Root627]|nr:hypothetical protein ASD68_04445 [Rhodanobacter sp. Root627]
MDTRILLARYRSGGLLPEAEAALLEVLADRGYAAEALERRNAVEIATSDLDEVDGTHRVSMGSSLVSSWRWLVRKVGVLALRAKEWACLRETWAQGARFGLLAVRLWAAQLATLFGFGLFVVANVFCDSGPLEKCFEAGLGFLAVGMTADALLIPAIVALLFPKKWFALYLKALPALSLAVCVAAIHWYRVLPSVCGRVAKLSALIALLSIAYLVLSGKKSARVEYKM